MQWTQYLLPIVFLGLIVWVHYILYIGDEREMADCSKIEVFLKEWKRMCDSLQRTCQRCHLCEMVNTGNCHTAMRTMPNLVIDAVQRWSDEHPPKTRQSEFLKMYPNTALVARDWLKYHPDARDDCSVIDICPRKVDTTLEVDCKDAEGCYACRKDFWLAEVE